MNKLFWEDPYQTECTARVTEIKENTIKLDQSIFFAFSGGQESDEGTIGGIKVKEARKQGDKENIIDIEYELETPPTFKVGDQVEVKINPEKRAHLRRLHSAAHVLWYLVIEKLGKLKCIGSNVSPTKARMDYITDTPVTPVLQEIETIMNKFIQEDHPIIMEPDPEKPDLRWWTCNNWKMPCGGTHAKSTKEIGPIKLKRRNLGSGKERIAITLQ